MIKNIQQNPGVIGKRKRDCLVECSWFDINQDIFNQHKDLIVLTINSYNEQETNYSFVLEQGQPVVRFYLNKLLTEEIISNLNNIAVPIQH